MCFTVPNHIHLIVPCFAFICNPRGWLQRHRAEFQNMKITEQTQGLLPTNSVTSNSVVLEKRIDKTINQV